MNVDCRCDKDEWYLRYWAIFLRLVRYTSDPQSNSLKPVRRCLYPLQSCLVHHSQNYETKQKVLREAQRRGTKGSWTA